MVCFLASSYSVYDNLLPNHVGRFWNTCRPKEVFLACRKKIAQAFWYSFI